MTEKTQPLTSSPTGPWKPVTPFGPDIPWGRSQEQGVSEVPTPRCPPQGAHCLHLIPCGRVRENRDHKGFAQSQENVVWSQGWNSGPSQRGEPRKGDGRKEQSRHGGAPDIPGFPVNSPEAQRDLAGHFLPSPPGKAKSSLSDGGEHGLGLGGRGREGATPCLTPAGLRRARTDTLTFTPFSPFSPAGPGSPKKP